MLGPPHCPAGPAELRKSAAYSGTVHFNGRPRDKLFPRISAYVPQDQIMLGSKSPKSHADKLEYLESTLKIWCKVIYHQGRLVCFADIQKDALNLAGRGDAKVLDGLRGKATVGFTMNPWKSHAFKIQNSFSEWWSHITTLPQPEFLHLLSIFANPQPPRSPKQHQAALRPLSSTACWSLNAPPWWVAKWHSSGSSDGWRYWASWRLRTAVTRGGWRGKATEKRRACDGKRWPNDVEFMDFTDGLEMFPYFFFLKNQTVMFSWS